MTQKAADTARLKPRGKAQCQLNRWLAKQELDNLCLRTSTTGGTAISNQPVTRVLEEFAPIIRLPQVLVTRNGPEFASDAIPCRGGAKRVSTLLHYPGYIHPVPLYRQLRRQVSRRMLATAPALRPARCQQGDRSMAGGLQLSSLPHFVGLPGQ